MWSSTCLGCTKSWVHFPAMQSQPINIMANTNISPNSLALEKLKQTDAPAHLQQYGPILTIQSIKGIWSRENAGMKSGCELRAALEKNFTGAGKLVNYLMPATTEQTHTHTHTKHS